MEYRELGKGGPRVSVVGLGTWQFGDPSGTYQKQSEEVEFQIVKAALDHGINFFDTAEAYGGGESERALGKALARTGRKRSEYVLASKVNNTDLSPERVVAITDQSLKNLGTPYLDLLQIHWPSSQVPLKDTMQAMEKLLKDGKIKAIGISNFGVLDTKDAIDTGVPFVSSQLPYSLITRSIELEITDVCKKYNIGILGYCPLAQGLLTGRYKTLEDTLKNPGLCRSRLFHKSRSPNCRHNEEGCEKELFAAIDAIHKQSEKLKIPMNHVALSWVIHQPGVTSVLVGASTPDHVTSNAKAASVKLNQEELKVLKEATDPVLKCLGKNPDLWALETRYR